VASSAHVDNRIMFSAGRAALEMGLFEKKIKIIMAIPLSVTGKSPFFDRK
ncbi:MAG: ferredoxin domain-containing protein, partial [Oscillospiraceae bacterium]